MIHIDTAPMNNLKKIRLSLGLTLKEMEEKTGITKGALSKIENRRSATNQNTIKSISMTIGMSANKIFNIDSEWVEL